MRPAPQSDFTILRCKVQYKIESSRAWSDTVILVSPPATSTILTRLEAGTRYSVRVKAMSTIGEGIWSMVEEAQHTGVSSLVVLGHLMLYIQCI